MFLLVSVLIVTSLVLTNLDQTLNSLCGAGCGFVLNFPQIFNPLDTLLVLASHVSMRRWENAVRHSGMQRLADREDIAYRAPRGGGGLGGFHLEED